MLEGAAALDGARDLAGEAEALAEAAAGVCDALVELREVEVRRDAKEPVSAGAWRVEAGADASGM